MPLLYAVAMPTVVTLKIAAEGSRRGAARTTFRQRSRPAVACLDVELRERARESGVDSRDLFVGDPVAQPRLGAAPCFFDAGCVDPVGRDRHVRHDRHALAGDFDETLANGEKLVAAIFAHDHFAGHDARQ
jgi:hypothetical protein